MNSLTLKCKNVVLKYRNTSLFVLNIVDDDASFQGFFQLIDAEQCKPTFLCISEVYWNTLISTTDACYCYKSFSFSIITDRHVPLSVMYVRTTSVNCNYFCSQTERNEKCSLLFLSTINYSQNQIVACLH